MLSTWFESCKSCITRVTGRVRCMSQIKGLSSRRRRREGMQRVQTAKSNMLLNLNLRDVLLRGHHDNPIAPSSCARRLARVLDTLALTS